MLDLVKVIQEESYTYRDPITSFIEDLYVKFDFDSGQQKLRECEDVLRKKCLILDTTIAQLFADNGNLSINVTISMC